MNWENLCPNSSFTVENKMEEFTQGWSQFSLTMMTYSNSSNFRNLSMNWEKYVFYCEKRNFELI